MSSFAGPSRAYPQPLPPRPEIAQEPQVLLVLVGLPGSGKSTFAEALVAASERYHPSTHSAQAGDAHSSATAKRRRWIRASQDDAPSRRRQECEARVRHGLREGCNVVVDRVDFDRQQRSHFINIAYQTRPRPLIHCLVFSVSIPTLESRLIARPSHPTIPDAETGLRVLRQMYSQFQPPRQHSGGQEGFDRVYTLPEGRQPGTAIWSEEEVWGVLEMVEREGWSEGSQRAEPGMNGAYQTGYDYRKERVDRRPAYDNRPRDPRVPPHWTSRRGGQSNYRGQAGNANQYTSTRSPPPPIAAAAGGHRYPIPSPTSNPDTSRLPQQNKTNDDGSPVVSNDSYSSSTLAATLP